MEKNIIEVNKKIVSGETMYEIIAGFQNSDGARMTTTLGELSFENLREIKKQISDVLLHDYMEQARETVKNKQKEYHNYPIGTIIYPDDNSYMELVYKKENWDGINHAETLEGLYHKRCKVVSKEYKAVPEDGYGNESYNFVNVEYNGAVYSVLICENINMANVEYIIEQDMYDEYSEVI